MIEAHGLIQIADVRHGFFTREGGYSNGIYASLNCGLGSDDKPDNVARNRTHIATALGLAPHEVLSLYQVHGRNVATVTEPWMDKDRPKADAMVTDQRGVALGILTADCAPLLFADEHAGVIGAAHAGWRGALAGIAQATLAAMVKLGADKRNIIAAIGPLISKNAYEVGPELRDAFIADASNNDVFFAPASREGHFMFDLGGFLDAALRAENIKSVERIDACTYHDDARFFSYRRACHRDEPDYGRQISAITLGPARFLES